MAGVTVFAHYNDPSGSFVTKKWYPDASDAEKPDHRLIRLALDALEVPDDAVLLSVNVERRIAWAADDA